MWKVVSAILYSSVLKNEWSNGFMWKVVSAILYTVYSSVLKNEWKIERMKERLKEWKIEIYNVRL